MYTSSSPSPSPTREYSIKICMELLTGKTIFPRLEGAGPVPPEVMMLIEHLTGESVGLMPTRPQAEAARQALCDQVSWMKDLKLPDADADANQLYNWVCRVELEHHADAPSYSVTLTRP